MVSVTLSLIGTMGSLFLMARLSRRNDILLRRRLPFDYPYHCLDSQAPKAEHIESFMSCLSSAYLQGSSEHQKLGPCSLPDPHKLAE